MKPTQLIHLPGAVSLLCLGAFAGYSENVSDKSAWTNPTFSADANGVLKQDLYVQFTTSEVTGATDPVSGAEINTIWTRAYGFKPNENTIPGPFYVFQPGDLVDLTMYNHLSPEEFPELSQFDNEVNPSYDTDEIIMKIMNEINVPHNPNNTNLHTHGLHVDPSRDDVDLVMAPKGDNAPYMDNVSDQPVKRGSWRYAYRIPNLHLPGTHWFHAHKHGSTSIHVENGMAGLLAIKAPSAGQAIVPSLWTESGFSEHDRPMILQEIANYAEGAQGKGKSLENPLQDADTGGAAAGPNSKQPSKAGSASPDITINGVHEPSLSLQPGQLERWRIVNAGANHRTFSYIWLGKVIRSGSDKTTVKQVPFHLVAIDGITLNRKEPITAARPLFLAPGNRADILVKPTEEGAYTLFKNYPSNVTIVDANGQTVPPFASGAITNPYGFPTLSAKKANFELFNVKWNNADGKVTDQQPIAPLLRAEAAMNQGQTLADIEFDTDFPMGKWQPVIHSGGGLIDSGPLVHITVQGDPLNDSLPSDDHLSRISPTGSGDLLVKTEDGANGIPAYATPIADADIAQSRVAVFDLSGVTVEVSPSDNSNGADGVEQIVKQFSLNGRQFSVEDYIGSPDALKLIQETPNIDGLLPSDSPIQLALNFTGAKNQAYANQLWLNPGYYSDVIGDATNGYTYQVVNDPKPTYRDVTGLTEVALANSGATNRAKNIPGPPVATTAEEWILINNSDIGHPFHIHISPFFVTEVGQLAYTDGAWSMNKLNESNKAGQPMGWVVGNWWDTILIPPHGYIKLRTWINVPQQSPLAEKDMKATTADGQKALIEALKNPDSITVADNVNREGAWVFHCHILRHEDRGMMMTVKTQPFVAAE